MLSQHRLQNQIFGQFTNYIIAIFFIAITFSMPAEAASAPPAITILQGKVISSKLRQSRTDISLKISLLVNNKEIQVTACFRGCGKLPRIRSVEPRQIRAKNIRVSAIALNGKKYVKRLEVLTTHIVPRPTPTQTPTSTPTPSKIPSVPSTPTIPTIEPPLVILEPTIEISSPTTVVTEQRFEVTAEVSSPTDTPLTVDFLKDGVVLKTILARPYKATISLNEPGSFVLQGKVRTTTGKEVISNAVLISSKEPSITLPIEVLGAKTAVSTLGFWLTQEQLSQSSKGLALEMQIFGLDYPDKGKVTLNNGWNVLLNNSTVKMSPRKKAFGGIGGSYSTIAMSLVIPASALKSGANTLSFEFTGTNGISIGFRVLRFNLVAAGKQVISEDRFLYEDPDAWKAPLSTTEAIATGKTLWATKTLKSSSLPDATSLRAHCSDCHVDDGYDLKYFNYSNKAIVERAKFHGLTETEGAKIASYIRSLSIPNPGRPWDPPYQPGPGIDSKPVNAWAAGAGVDWVLEDDAQSIQYMFPKGIPKEIDLRKNFNHREVPIALELPVWNDWLPRIHPLDYWGDKFIDSGVPGASQPTGYYEYSKQILEQAKKDGTLTVASFNAWREGSGLMFAHGFISPNSLGRYMPPQDKWTPRDNIAKYSVLQWSVVKGWGLMRKYELEGRGAIDKLSFGYFNTDPSVEPPAVRHWPMYGQFFRVAPHILQMSLTNHGIRDGTRLTWESTSLAWYYLQMILDSNTRGGDGSTHWPYMLAFTGLNSEKNFHASMRVISLIKMMESYYNNNLPKDGVAVAWNGMLYQHLMGNVSPASYDTYSGLKPDVQIAVTEMLQRTFLKRTRYYTRDQLYATPTYFTGSPATDLGPHADTIYFNQRFYHVVKALSELNVEGRKIDRVLINELVDFGQYLWPEIYKDFQVLRR